MADWDHIFQSYTPGGVGMPGFWADDGSPPLMEKSKMAGYTAREYAVKATEQQAEFDSGAHRSAAVGRGRYDLLPTVAIRRDAIHMEKGAAVHGDRNWEKGMPVGRSMQSLLRHAFQYLDGDTSEDHLAAIRFNAAAIMDAEERHPAMCDLPWQQERLQKQDAA